MPENLTITMDYSQWAIACLIRELDKQMTEYSERNNSSRYYIFNLIKAHRPSSLQDSVSQHNCGFLMKHLVHWWNAKHGPVRTESLQVFRDELQRRVEAHEAIHGVIRM